MFLISVEFENTMNFFNVCCKQYVLKQSSSYSSNLELITFISLLIDMIIKYKVCRPLGKKHTL